MPYLKEKGIKARPDINEWFYNSLPIPSHDLLARHYIKEGMREPLRSDFVRYIRDVYDLPDDDPWDFGQDDEEHREDLTDLLQYMIRLSEWNPYLPSEPAATGVTGACDHGRSDDGWDGSLTAEGLPYLLTYKVKMMHLGPMLTYKVKLMDLMRMLYFLNQKVKLMDLVWMVVYLLVMLGLQLLRLIHLLSLVAIGKRSQKFKTRKRLRPGV